ncbi:MAG TPA: hypothetical protein PK760_06990 [Flavobacteriales bacterium]|nr:hypothetical protein [Flavobacteriales bacterium]
MFPTACQAQFDLGFAAGGYVYHPYGFEDGSLDAPTFSRKQLPSPTATVFYSERSARKANLFAQVDYTHAAFAMNTAESVHVGGTGRILNLRLDALHFTIGPEFGRGAFKGRFGIQFGGYVGARMSGDE